MAAHFEIPLVLVESLRAARHVAALTGSGISAESGIPTFRDAQTGPSASSGQALWSKYRPEELATPEAFRRNPRLVWEWYEWRRGLVAKAAPNPGHLALAELERRVPRFTLITQNAEGPHPRPSLLTTASRGVVRRGEQCTLRLFSRLRFSSQGKRLGSEVYNTDAFIHNGQPL